MYTFRWRPQRKDMQWYLIPACIVAALATLFVYAYGAASYGQESRVGQRVLPEVQAMPVISVPNVPTHINMQAPANQVVIQTLAALREVWPQLKPDTYWPAESAVVMPGMVYKGCGEDEIRWSVALACREDVAVRYVFYYSPLLDSDKTRLVGRVVQTYLRSLVVPDRELTLKSHEALTRLQQGGRLEPEFAVLIHRNLG